MNKPIKVTMTSDFGPVAVEIVALDQVRLSLHLDPPRGPNYTFVTHKVHGHWQMALPKLLDAQTIFTATQAHIAFVKWARQHPNLFRMVSLLQRTKK